MSCRASAILTKVALTDPSPGPCNDAEAFEEDIRCFGTLIYFLVMQRPFSRTTWPIPDSAEWKRHLGRRGDAWRQLCSDLLNPNPKARPSLADIKASLQSLIVRNVPIRKIATILLAAGAGLGAILLGARLWVSNVRNTAQAHEDWLAAVDDPAQSSLLTAEPKLPNLADCLLRDAASRDSIQSALATHGLGLLQPSAISDILHARATAREGHLAWIAAWRNDADAIAKEISRYQSLGWQIPPNLLPKLEIAENADPQDLLSRAKMLREFRDRIHANDPTARWAWLETQLGQLQAVKDNQNNFLIQCAAQLRGSAAGAIRLSQQGWDISEPALRQVEDITARLVQKSAINFNADRMRKDEPAIHFDKPVLADMEAWWKSVDDYKRVPKAGADAADECGKWLANEVVTPAKQHPEQWKQTEGEPFQTRKRSIEDDIAALRQSSDFVEKDCRPESKTVNSLIARRGGIYDKINKLRGDFYQPPEDPAVYVDSLPPLNLQHPELEQQLWRTYADKLRAMKAGDFSGNQWPQRKLQCDAFRKLLRKLDSFAPVPLDVAVDYQKIMKARQGVEMNALIDRVSASQTLMADDLARLEAEIEQKSVAFSTWCDYARALSIDFAEMAKARQSQQIVELTHFPDEAWTGANADPGKGQFWKDEVLSSSGQFRHLLEADLKRLDELHAVQAADLAAVMQSLLAPETSDEIVIACWRRLAREPEGILNKPAAITTLHQEGLIRKRLRETRDRLAGTNSASDTLRHDLDAEMDRSPARWCQAFKSCQSKKDIQDAVRQSSPYNVSPQNLTEVATKYALAPAGDYNALLAWTLDAIAYSSASQKELFVLLARRASRVPALIPMAEWLTDYASAATEPPAPMLLDESLYWLRKEPPEFLPRMLEISQSLRSDKKQAQPDVALKLLNKFLGFKESSKVIHASPLRWGDEFYAIGTVYSTLPTRHSEAAFEAFKESWLLGNGNALLPMCNANPMGAVPLLKTSADQGNIVAQTILARFYSNGTGVPRSELEARKLFERIEESSDHSSEYWKIADSWLREHPILPPVSQSPLSPSGTQGPRVNKGPVALPPPP